VVNSQCRRARSTAAVRNPNASPLGRKAEEGGMKKMVVIDTQALKSNE
jgi:hypothetical protein